MVILLKKLPMIETSTPIASKRSVNERNCSLTERELIVLLQAKDAKAFSVLYDRYAPTLFSITLKIVPVSPLAEDVLQEAFVKIWRTIHQYDPRKGRLFTWLLNIVRHTAIDLIRQVHCKKASLTYAGEEAYTQWDQQASHATPVDHLGLESLLTQLTNEQYRLIEYLYFRGYTQAEAAQELAIPLGTVKTRTRTALSQLRKWAIPLIQEENSH